MKSEVESAHAQVARKDNERLTALADRDAARRAAAEAERDPARRDAATAATATAVAQAQSDAGPRTRPTAVHRPRHRQQELGAALARIEQLTSGQ